MKTTPRSFTLPAALAAITLFLALLAAACSQRSDENKGSGPVCGNGTCENGESALSCSEDCTSSTCDNDGTCESGEDHASCANDCDADELPPAGSEKWVCRPSYRGGKAYWSCNPDPQIIAGSPEVVDFVGRCPALDLRDYYGANGSIKQVEKNDAGWYEAEVPAGADPNDYCEMTYAYKKPDGTVVWAQYGTNSPVNSVAGDYRECGTRNNVFACGMFFKPVPGHMPAPLDRYPN